MQNSTANLQRVKMLQAVTSRAASYCTTLAHTGFTRQQAACFFGLSLRTTTNMLAGFASSSSQQQQALRTRSYFNSLAPWNGGVKSARPIENKNCLLYVFFLPSIETVGFATSHRNYYSRVNDIANPLLYKLWYHQGESNQTGLRSQSCNVSQSAVLCGCVLQHVTIALRIWYLDCRTGCNRECELTWTNSAGTSS